MLFTCWKFHQFITIYKKLCLLTENMNEDSYMSKMLIYGMAIHKFLHKKSSSSIHSISMKLQTTDSAKRDTKSVRNRSRTFISLIITHSCFCSQFKFSFNKCIYLFIYFFLFLFFFNQIYEIFVSI